MESETLSKIEELSGGHLTEKVSVLKEASDSLGNDVLSLNNAASEKEITVKRGRLIRKIKSEIKKIKEQKDVKASDLDALEKLEELLDSELGYHRNQLDKRYKSEFLDKKATIKAIFTTLPKGVGIQAKKVANCINELKSAKTNKERIFDVISLGKNLGLFVATPVIFTAKFVVEHWYLLLLLLLLLLRGLPDFKFGFANTKGDNNNNSNDYSEQEEYATSTDEEYENVTNMETTPVVESVPVVEDAPALKASLSDNPLERFIFKDGQLPENSTISSSDIKAPSADFIRGDESELVSDVTNGTTEEQTTIFDKVNDVTNGTTEEQTTIFDKINDSISGFNNPLGVPSIESLRESVQLIKEQGVSSLVGTANNSDAGVISEDSYFDILKQLVPKDVSDSNFIVNTYDDALAYYMDNLGVSEDIATKILAGEYNNVYLPSVKWLVGEGGIFGTEGEEVMNTSVDEMVGTFDKYKDELGNLFNTISSGGNVLDALRNTSSGLLLALLCYEVLQYGLAIPTGGFSLLAPG